MRRVSMGTPEILVLVTCVASGAIAIIDPTYREHFSRIADAIIVGFWAWMQATKRNE